MTDVTTRPDSRDPTLPLTAPSTPSEVPGTGTTPVQDNTFTGPPEWDQLADEDDDLGPAIPVSGLPSVPRAAATNKLAEALTSQMGMERDAAYAIARSVVRPEEARRRLAFPVAERVPGGTIYSISVPVFSSALATYPVNLRESVDRKYAFAGVRGGDDGYPSLSQVTSESGETAELVVHAQSREHVIASLQRSQAFLRENNRYEDSIARNGVLREVYAVAVRVEHQDGSPAVCTLGTADGSSRIGSCHRLTGATPDQIVYGWPSDDRMWRTMLGRDVTLSGKAAHDLTPGEQGRVRAMIVPCKLALRYEPDEGSELTFAQAVRFVVGLTHVEPPSAWDKASELDALAESVLDELVRSQRIHADEARYLGGDLTPEDAVARGFSPLADERAAHIYKTLLKPDNLAVTKRGVRRVTAKARIDRNRAVDVAVELGLRAWRPTLDRSQASTADGVRSASQRCLRMSEIGDHAWAITGRSPERLREAALAELDSGVTAGPAALELAILASWHLLTKEQLKRELSKSFDRRSLDKVLRMLMTTRHGVHQLTQALIDGRSGKVARNVDEEGSIFVPEVPPGRERTFDDWVRRTWPESTDVEINIDEALTQTPESQLRRAQDTVVALVTRLETAVSAVRLVPGAQRPLVQERGWSSSEVSQLMATVDTVAHQLRTWSAIYDAGQVVRNTDDS